MALSTESSSYVDGRRQTAGLAAYYREGLETFILMQMRSANARYNPGTYGFFGGGVEDGETLEEALHREIQEELNVAIGRPIYFKHYEGTIADADIFLYEVGEDFTEGITVSEGDHARFIPLSSWRGEPIADFTQRIVADLEDHLRIA